MSMLLISLPMLVHEEKNVSCEIEVSLFCLQRLQLDCTFTVGLCVYRWIVCIQNNYILQHDFSRLLTIRDLGISVYD